jgi:acyl CoA:acetate/3-ketoacid CoA transferase alpha subunit
LRGAELRIAETRAVNRALRKAYGIGICSVEELGSPPADPAPKPVQDNHQHHNGSNNGQPRLRDQLCILIRQHNLDATLVKAYAADFCGTATLSGARRELVESFISHLSAAAKENRNGLICKLNSYAQQQEAKQ